MGRSPDPTAAELQALDPDGHFHERLEADRLRIIRQLATGDDAALRATVHRLAGAAGTFGFTEVGDIAIALDDAAIAGAPLAAQDMGRLLAALARATEKSV